MDGDDDCCLMRMMTVDGNEGDVDGDSEDDGR